MVDVLFNETLWRIKILEGKTIYNIPLKENLYFKKNKKLSELKHLSNLIYRNYIKIL